MGAPVVSAAAYAKGAPLEMMQMPHTSWLRTHEYEFVTTDSAASATALSTGHKTHFEGVSVAPGTGADREGQADSHLSHMVEASRAAGWRSGLVATSRIVHATPAAFAAHRAHRGSYEQIALDMADSGVDVLLGAGTRYFGNRSDKVDLLQGLRDKGYTVATDAAQVAEAAGSATKLVGLMHDKDMPSVSAEEPRAMSLAQMTQAAIDVLDCDNERGFFLMVEGSQIDWHEHAMDARGAVMETLDFDEAVGIARRYASERDDTLVIVTADHETGGLSLLDHPTIDPYIEQLGGGAGRACHDPICQRRDPLPGARDDHAPWHLRTVWAARAPAS